METGVSLKFCNDAEISVGNRSKLDTLVVTGRWVPFRDSVPQQRIKHSAWGVRPQVGSKELTGAASGGACGLIRNNAKNLTRHLDIPLTALGIGFSFGTEVTGGAWLSSARVVR